MPQGLDGQGMIQSIRVANSYMKYYRVLLYKHNLHKMTKSLTVGC